MFRSPLSRVIALSLIAACVVPAYADEGLWTFDNFPSGEVKAIYGVDITRGWLDHVMKAAVRLPNGCSASLVSSTGLVLTNNHCVSECAQGLSGLGHDEYTDGFVAGDKRNEKRCSNLNAEVLTSVTDVTPRVTQVGAGLNGAALVKAHTAAIEEIEKKACSGDPITRCQVTEFYQGGQYKLFKYRKYDDVRLVFSPGVSASLFGGSEFPPYSFDAAFLRVYDKGNPAVTPDHLRWNSTAPRADEPVFVAGSPRISERQLTINQLQTERDMALPYELVQAAELIGRLVRFGEESGENKRASQYQLDDLRNHFSYIFDLQMSLSNESFFAKKVSEEADLRSKAGPAIETQMSAIAQAEQARRDQALAYQYVVDGPSSELFRYARILVRGAIERSKPSSERLPNYADRQLPLREQQLFDKKSVYAPFEELQLEFWLSGAGQYLGSDNQTLRLLLGSETPEELSSQLSQSKLGDETLRQQLWRGGLAAIQASSDPMIRYVLQIEPAARELQTKWEDTVTGPETRAAATIAQARFKSYRTSVYPDANRTLRLSYGKIKGLDYDGKSIGPFTTFGDLYQHATGNEAYRLNQRWVAAKSKLNPQTVLNMSTTNDGINGNSGSPLLNARGEVIGAFFGGNTFAMGGDYGYDPKLNRAVAVSAAAVMEVLVKIYAADDLSRELASTAN
jgi:V8-like Glu-specific endopeptidase